MSPKDVIEMSQEGAIVLPRWFLWLVAVIGVPTFLGAVPWAYSVQLNLTEINVTLKYMTENNTHLERRIEVLEGELDDHLRDPEIHSYEFSRLRGELNRINDRLERLEGRE